METFRNNKSQIDNKFAQYVEYRIIEWARWFKSPKTFAAGYPSRSIEHRLMTEGIIVKQQGPLPIPYHEEAEEIEDAVKEMHKRYPTQAEALRIYYLGEKDTLKLGASRFRIYLNLGRMWIASKLDEQF